MQNCSHKPKNIAQQNLNLFLLFIVFLSSINRLPKIYTVVYINFIFSGIYYCSGVRNESNGIFALGVVSFSLDKFRLFN